jgi:TPR repeat protein
MSKPSDPGTPPEQEIEAMINRGIAAMQDGDVEEARTWYTRAAEAGDTKVMSSPRSHRPRRG